jgi:Protein of unknown function (DUF1569)
MSVNTGKVKDRRKLRFESFDGAVRDAEMLAEAERRGTLRTTGNWTLGQAIGHVAAWARFPFDGYPPMPRLPWFMRLLVPLFKNSLLNRRLPAGARIGSVPGGTFATEPMEADAAIPRLREAFDRLKRESPVQPNPLLGPLTHDDWIKLNLRHAELHFSFFHPS